MVGTGAVIEPPDILAPYLREQGFKVECTITDNGGVVVVDGDDGFIGCAIWHSNTSKVDCIYAKKKEDAPGVFVLSRAAAIITQLKTSIDLADPVSLDKINEFFRAGA